MDKALVVQSEWSELKGGGIFKIIKQDNIETLFNRTSNCFKGSNGTILKSVGSPELHGPDGDNTMYVRGSSKKDDDNIISTTNKDLFNKFLVTIDEYNEAMARHEVKELTQSTKDHITNHSKYLAKRVKGVLDTFAENIDESKNVSDAMNAKVQLMTSLLSCIPMGVETCPFCVINHNDCSVCEYKNKHGNCLNKDSTYQKISDMIGNLRNYISNNYWKGL